MQTTFALAALAAVAYAAPQGVTGNISPSSPAPAGCSPDYSGKFEITIINETTTKRDLSERQATNCGQPGYLTLTLAGGKLTDAQGRTGYIAANYQFQFDAPAQTGAIYTAGFSVCQNGSLALGGSNTFYQCLSGDFYNLYDRSWAAQCSPILIDLLPCGSSNAPVGQGSDGQPAATTQGSLPPVTQIPDGQPQASTAVPRPVTQISDGQIQAPTGKPVTQISDGQIQIPTGKPVTQISDGQVQAPTGKPVTQISDGQVQAPTGKPVTQISDGQVQAPTGKPVTQISDGQIQAPKTTASTPTKTGAPVTQISDGQVQSGKNATTTPVPFVGSGHGLNVASSFAAVVVGIAAVLLL